MAAIQITPLISDFMKTLRDEYGFDTLAVRRIVLDAIRASDQRNPALLDVGAGSGWMAIMAAQSGYEVVSIDPDEEGLIRAKNRARQVLKSDAGRIRFLHADASQMPFDDNGFDVVLSFDVVHHFADCVCPAAMDEMIRVCKPGGELLIADLNGNGMNAVRSVHELAGLTHEENRCGVREIDEILRDAGLDVTRRETRFVTLFHAFK